VIKERELESSPQIHIFYRFDKLNERKWGSLSKGRAFHVRYLFSILILTRFFDLCFCIDIRPHQYRQPMCVRAAFKGDFHQHG